MRYTLTLINQIIEDEYENFEEYCHANSIDLDDPDQVRNADHLYARALLALDELEGRAYNE